jgi:hypothetical protein
LAGNLVQMHSGAEEQDWWEGNMSSAKAQIFRFLNEWLKSYMKRAQSL